MARCDDSLCQKRQANGTSVMENYLSEGESYPNWLNAYYAVDHLGTPRDILNVATGQTLKASDYSPFGGAEASAVRLKQHRIWFCRYANFPVHLGQCGLSDQIPAIQTWLWSLALCHFCSNPCLLRILG